MDGIVAEAHDDDASERADIAGDGGWREGEVGVGVGVSRTACGAGYADNHAVC